MATCSLAGAAPAELCSRQKRSSGGATLQRANLYALSLFTSPLLAFFLLPNIFTLSSHPDLFLT